MHVFPYSPRPGHRRRASSATGSTPQEKKRRCQVLRGALGGPLATAPQRQARPRQTVLIDKVADSQCSGYTADYTRCYLPAGAGDRGELVTATARELHADGIRCGA